MVSDFSMEDGVKKAKSVLLYFIYRDLVIQGFTILKSRLIFEVFGEWIL